MRSELIGVYLFVNEQLATFSQISLRGSLAIDYAKAPAPFGLSYSLCYKYTPGRPGALCLSSTFLHAKSIASLSITVPA